MENTKTIQVFSEKQGKMIDIDVISKEADSMNILSCVMLVVDEEE